MLKLSRHNRKILFWPKQTKQLSLNKNKKEKPNYYNRKSTPNPNPKERRDFTRNPILMLPNNRRNRHCREEPRRK
jgi:hypothetical protein